MLHNSSAFIGSSACRCWCQSQMPQSVGDGHREYDKKVIKTCTSEPRLLILFLLIPSFRMQYPALASAVIQISSFSHHVRSCLLFMHHFVAQCRSHLCNGFGVCDALEPHVPSVIIFISCNREETSDIWLYLKCFKPCRGVIHPQFHVQHRKALLKKLGTWPNIFFNQQYFLFALPFPKFLVLHYSWYLP